MRNLKKITCLLFSIFLFVLITVDSVNADAFDPVLKRWAKSLYYTDDAGANLTINCTYYSAEYVEAYIQSEAQKNLWTRSETDDFKYKFLASLNLNEMIPIYIEFVNNGPTMHLGPFDNMVSLRIKNKTYKPVEYDKRFNFRFQGKKDGLVFFQRYDDKTGKDLLAGVTSVRLDFKSAINPMLDGRRPYFIWDINKDDPSKLYQGTTGARMETDRLIKRLEKLRKDKAEEEAKLASINGEISTIQARLDELAKQ